MMVSKPWVLVPTLVLNSSLFLWWGWGGVVGWGGWEDECGSARGGDFWKLAF